MVDEEGLMNELIIYKKFPRRAPRDGSAHTRLYSDANVHKYEFTYHTSCRITPARVRVIILLTIGD